MKNNLLFRGSASYVLPSLLYFLVLFCVPNSFAQNIPITGTVYDAQGPLPGVNVSVKNTTNATFTDANGAFQITATPQDTLVFSSVGYVTVTTQVGLQTTLKIIMQPDETTLEEVLVNAGYYKVKDKERTGSIAKITAKDIENQPVGNVIGVLQGRMAGVEIIQESGSPGGGFQIKIRGQNSLRSDGNDPLYIIDGVPYSSETIGWTTTSGGNPSMTNPLSAINPNDIESIEILKDGDATAIYGSRGANGVVLISTKKGKSGVTKFSINAATSVGTVTKMLDLMNTEQYLAMRRQAFINDGISDFPAAAYDVNGTWDQTRYTDWQKELIGGTAQITNLQASVSGGTDQTSYLLSGTTRNETTVFPGDFEYNRNSVHFSMKHNSLDKRFGLTFSANYNAQRNIAPVTDLTQMARQLAPNAPAIYDANGQLNWADNTWDNPLANYESKFKAKINDLNANAILSYKILPNFTIQSSFGFSELTNSENSTQPSTMYNPSYGLGSESSLISINNTGRHSWIAEPQLNYKFEKGKNNIEALAGATFQSQTTNRLFQTGFGFSSNSLIYDLASAFQKFVEFSDESEYRYQAIYARVNYNYDSRYILNVTGRRDGSSRFGSGKQFANFGAVGAAWLFSNEAWLQNNKVLSFGKIRTSYGLTGSDQIGDYQYLDTYTSSGNTYEGVAGLEPLFLLNPAFGWETSRKFEVALETGFFKDRVFTSLAYYRNSSSNQLVGLPLPGTTGFTSLTANLDAEVENKGWELTLRSVNFKSKNVEWTTNFNISKNKNKVLSYPGLENSSNANRFVVGQPISVIKLYHYTGIDPVSGVYQFEDSNNDGSIKASDDKQTLVDLTPDFFGGLQNEVRFKSLKLDFLLQFVKKQAFNYQAVTPGRAFNQLAQINDTWTAQNDKASYQVLTSGTNGNANAAYARFNESDAAVVDGSYIRLKSIVLSYDLPLNSPANNTCRLFLQGQNLLTFTTFEGDPEFKFAGYLPPLKTFTLGMQFTF